jgi:hypothetical protein
MEEDAMGESRVEELLSKAIAASSVVEDGSYTRPRTWGVYVIEPEKHAATKRFRFGNHPVRQRELTQEFGKARLYALFESRLLAVELTALMNAAPGR